MTESALALVAATVLLVLLPGPNAALIVATSLRHGRRQGLTTVAGTTAGVAMQLVVVVAGYSALLGAVAGLLAWIKWAGVIVLAWLGLRAWRDAARIGEPEPPRQAVAFRRGLLLASINPKTLLFKASFLPQFVSGATAVDGQLVLLAALYLLVVAIGDCGWVLLAGLARRLLARAGRWAARLQGALLMAAAAALGLARAEP